MALQNHSSKHSSSTQMPSFVFFHFYAKALPNQGRESFAPTQPKEGTGHQLPAVGQMIEPPVTAGKVDSPPSSAGSLLRAVPCI